MELVTTQVLSSECYQSFRFEPIQFKGKEEYPLYVWFFYFLAQEPEVELQCLTVTSSVEKENHKKFLLAHELEKDMLRKSFSELYLLGVTFSVYDLCSWDLDIRYKGKDYSFRGFADSSVITVFFKDKEDNNPKELLESIDKKLQNL